VEAFGPGKSRERAVWARDESQCSFVDGEGRRCAERRSLTLEHRTPFALGGPATRANLCLHCSAHNLENVRQVFREPHIDDQSHFITTPASHIQLHVAPVSCDEIAAVTAWHLPIERVL